MKSELIDDLRRIRDSLRYSWNRSHHNLTRRSISWVKNAALFGKTFPDYDALLGQIRNSGTSSLSHFKNGYLTEGGLLLQQNPDEFACLVLLLRTKRPINKYFEIGTASGGTVLFLSQNVGMLQVVTMDDGDHRDFHAQDAHLKEIPHVRRFIGNSHSTKAEAFLRETFPMRDIDVAFIDGDHTSEGVMRDIQMTLPYCKRGAWVIFHDTVACSGVDKAWRDALESGALKPIVELRGPTLPLGIAIGSVL